MISNHEMCFSRTARHLFYYQISCYRALIALPWNFAIHSTVVMKCSRGVNESGFRYFSRRNHWDLEKEVRKMF